MYWTELKMIMEPLQRILIFRKGDLDTLAQVVIFKLYSFMLEYESLTTNGISFDGKKIAVGC